MLGIQNDESLFAQPWFDPRYSEDTIRVGHTRLPLMLMSYLGTLKSWIYRPLFRLLGTGVAVIRIPVLLAGVASVWLCYRLLLRLAGKRAALIGCVFLAADSMYLICTCFDWGPVALQHLLMLGGVLLLLRFWQDGKERALAAGFFLFGLAAWDKAIAFWTLSGLGVAALVTIPRQLRQVLSRRRLVVAVAAFSLGAWPLIHYNVRNRLETFRGNVVYEKTSLADKAAVLQGSFDGSLLFGWLVAENAETPQPHPPRGWIQTFSANLASLAGDRRSSLMFYGFCAALLLAPFAGTGRRLILFAAVAMAVGWVEMLLTATAGSSVHHTILLWPLPLMIMGISLAGLSRRLGQAGTPVLITVMAVLLGSELLVTNHYYALAVRNGGAINWTDAVYSLSDYLKSAKPPTLYSVDWGTIDCLRLLNRGKLRQQYVDVPGPEHSPEELRYVKELLSGPGGIFLGHTAQYEFFRGHTARLMRVAQEAGYRREPITTIADSYGRPTYEIYRFVPASGATSN